ncbi:MAG TPA: hypothetical protein VGG10_18750 [Rhizomicrobium sp.]|jgi:hypothetical protein
MTGRQLDWVEMIGHAPKRYPDVPGACGKGATFEVAAAKAAHTGKSVRLRCLEILATGEFTSDEIAERLGLKTTQVRPRVSQLAKLDQIRGTGTTRPNADNNPMHVYRLAQGPEAAS